MGDRLVETVIAQRREREFDRGIPDATLKRMMPDFWGLLKEEPEFGKSPAKQPGYRVVYFLQILRFSLAFCQKSYMLRNGGSTSEASTLLCKMHTARREQC